MLDQIIDAIGKYKSDLRKLSDAIWKNPETAYKEFFAVEKITELLEKSGFSVTGDYCGIETALRCEFDNGNGPVFAVASEYDALPEIGHGCGHNLICVAGIATFLAMAQIMKKYNIPGKVILFGTPAEEGGGGKVRMAEAGCLDGVDAVIMVHPMARNTPDMGSTANCGINVAFHGKSAHAASCPEEGINALDAVNLLFTGVNTFRQYVPEHVRIHGVILDGGNVPNVIPDYASCRFYLRTADEAWAPILEKRFLDIVKGAELMTGATAEISYFRPAYKARRPNLTMNNEYIRCMEAQGMPVFIPERAGRGSSDFGNFSQLIPGIHAYFAVSENSEPAGHSVDFAAEAGKDFAFENAMRAAAAQASVICRFLTEEEFRNAVKADFSSVCR